jgi:hypothetical protein
MAGIVPFHMNHEYGKIFHRHDTAPGGKKLYHE